MKLIYVLSNEGETKNYIKQEFPGGISFTREKDEAIRYTDSEAKELSNALTPLVGLVFAEEDL